MVCQLSVRPSFPSDASIFCGIVGRSIAMREVFAQIETVAATDATVLIVGETGTGKELVANAVQALSARRGGPFVKLNCSAMPPTLLESELFGHVRGAFTGAVARRVGRFELANRGTMFLDEVGELPLEMQPKLLRVLQEREFEALGSSQTVHADVRLVAATHRSLGDMRARGTFREDLFYRLNVFPIHLPALRERRDDIPVLVANLLPRIARLLGKDVREVSDESMASLCAHDWPGNVRELQNVLERAVILAHDQILEVRVGPAESSHSLDSRPRLRSAPRETLEDVNRAHILAVLRSTKGVVAGPNGAAARLGLKRSTLHFRMRKLGIERNAFEAT